MRPIDADEQLTVQPDVPDTNVGDTISRQAAIDAVEKYACNTQRTYEAIKNLPPVQPTITYCENCEHWDTSWKTVYGTHYCPMIDMATKKNFFCKYGTERKGGEDGQK